MHKGVYSIPCSCDKFYIDETGRSMKVRFKEHSADLTLNRIQKSALAAHSSKTSHHICLENANTIARVDHYERIKVMESLEIELHPNNLNRDEGLKLNANWKPLLHMLKRYHYLFYHLTSWHTFGYKWINIYK